MIQIGRRNKLKIKRKRDYGAQLDGGESGDIILPKRYLPAKCRAGDEVEVFIYVNNEGRLRASTQFPRATVGQFAKLQVVANTPSGSFLDWGLQKDLLVPKKEQHSSMEEGKFYVVFIFLDEKNRITASTKLEKFLGRQAPDYDQDQAVDLVLFDQTDLGYKAVINNAHMGMIFKNEVFQKLSIGQHLKGYIKKIRDDGKIDLRLQQPGYQKVGDISHSILNAIKKHGGSIAVNDKSPPGEIYKMFGVSKKVFKQAIGALYKKRLIVMDSKGIRLAKGKKEGKRTKDKG